MRISAFLALSAVKALELCLTTLDGGLAENGSSENR